MEKTKLLFVSLCVASLLYSCGEVGEEQRLLESIEQTWRLCEVSLPEAQARASGLRDSAKEASEYVRQKYDLLAIRLRDKRYIVPSSPDSALQTMAYFEGRDNAVDKERACYYLGSAYRDLKDYPRAVSLFLKTVDAAKQCQHADTLLWQNALSQLRYLYMLQLNYEEELSVALQAVELAQQSGTPLGGYLVDAASAYEHLNDTLRCLQYCNQSYLTIQKEHFPPRNERHLAYILAMYAKYKHYEKVDTLLQHLMQLPENQHPHNYELSLAMYHENVNQTDSAIPHYRNYYRKEGSLSGRYEASAGLQRCYRQEGDLAQAVEWGCRLYDTNDSIIHQRSFEETQRARDAYAYYRDKEKELAIVQRDAYIKTVSFISGFVLLSIVIVLLAFLSHKRKKLLEEIVGKDNMLRSAKEEILHRQEELKLKQQEIELLGSQLEEAEQTIANSKNQMENTLKELEQRAMVNRELTRIALMNNATDKVENVITHFRKVASGQSRLGDNSWKELMMAIETLYPGFLEKVQGRMKRPMREPLLHTICLMKIGMTLVQIAQVMEATRQTVWNRMRRAAELCGDLLAVA